MAHYPGDTTSTDGQLTQQVGLLSTKDLRIEHWIELNKNEDARLRNRKIYLPGSIRFIEICNDLEIDKNTNAKAAVEYIYDIFEVDRDYPISKTYPENQPYYFLSGKHCLIAVATINPGGVVGSTTAGEAL